MNPAHILNMILQYAFLLPFAKRKSNPMPANKKGRLNTAGPFIFVVPEARLELTHHCWEWILRFENNNLKLLFFFWYYLKMDDLDRHNLGTIQVSFGHSFRFR